MMKTDSKFNLILEPILGFISISICYRISIWIEAFFFESQIFRLSLKQFAIFDLYRLFVSDLFTAIIFSLPFSIFFLKPHLKRRYRLMLFFFLSVGVSFLYFLHLRLFSARGDVLGPQVWQDIAAGGGLDIDELLEYGATRDFLMWAISIPLSC